MEFKDMIVYEDSAIVVVNKPSSMPSQPDKTGDKSVEDMANQYYREKLNNKRFEIGLIHRLDRPVSGLMVLGKSKKATATLNEMIAKRSVIKLYKAVCSGIPKEDSVELVDYLKKLKTTSMSKVVSQNDSGGKKAVLRYEVLSSITHDGEDMSLLQVELETGRHHQIRVQLSNHGCPIWGDTKYNRVFKREGFSEIALYCYRLKFKHPTEKKEIDIELDLPERFPFTLF